MTIETLQYVYAAYRCGSYKEASYEMSVTYSVVAKQVARAEEELGTRIFERASKSKEMKLTKAGQIIIKDIETILDSYRHIQGSISELDRTARKKLTICYGYYLVCEEELEIMQHFISSYPDIIMTQKRGRREENKKKLELGTADGIFQAYIGEDYETQLEYEFPDSDYEIQPVSSGSHMHFFMSEMNPLARKTTLTIEDKEEILEQTFLLMDTSEGGVRKILPYLAQYFGKDALRMKIRYMDSSNLPLVSDLLTKGNYVFPMARRYTKPIAGIKAAALVDWCTQVHLFFISRKGDEHVPLQKFRKMVMSYKD